MGSTSARLSPAMQRVPRDVPASVRWTLRLASGTGFAAWAVLGFGSIFFWTFAVNADVASLWQFAGDEDTVTGRIVETHQTGFSTGGSRRRAGGAGRKGRPVFAYTFSFKDANGIERGGTSYESERGLGPGSEVKIEYPTGRPRQARIVGMRRKPMPAGLGVLGVVPLVGLVMIALSWRAGRRAAALLEYGSVSAGRLVSKAPTSARVNKQRVYKLTFEFEGSDRRTHRATVRTHATRLLEDDPHELLLYDPADPTRALPVDKLPAGVSIRDDGSITQKRPLMLWAILPVIVIVGNTAAAMWSVS